MGNLINATVVEITDHRQESSESASLVGFYDSFMTQWGHDIGACDHSISLWSCDSCKVKETKAYIKGIHKGQRLRTYKNIQHAKRFLSATYCGLIKVSIYDGK